MIRTIEEATKVLRSYIPAPGLMHHNYTLDRMDELMELLGNPQNDYKVVHVAGTSGKTSTAYFIQGLLQAAGQKTGLTVSPHIQSVTERIQIDGRPISDEKFIYYLNVLLEKLATSSLQPTYFELLMALAYMTFREENVEYAVIETGLGGLLDATNVVTRPDKFCVITDIGLDHTDVLGKTVDEIALQKTGIVQPGNTLVVQHQADAIERIITEHALSRGANTVKIAKSPEADSFVLPVFQQRNWALAVTAYDEIATRDMLPQSKTFDGRELMMHQPPGRMEIILVNDKIIILDGAHNPQKMQAFVASLQEKGYGQLDVLVSFVDDKKDILEETLQQLEPVVKSLTVTNFSVMRDVGRTASPTEDIVKAAQKLGYKTERVDNPEEALQAMLDSSSPVIVVTGSLYLVAQLRGALKSLVKR